MARYEVAAVQVHHTEVVELECWQRKANDCSLLVPMQGHRNKQRVRQHVPGGRSQMHLVCANGAHGAEWILL